MKITKIKQVVPGFDQQSGPSSITKLGIQIGDHAIMLGDFYVGPRMDETHRDLLQQLEAAVDHLVQLSRSSGLLVNPKPSIEYLFPTISDYEESVKRDTGYSFSEGWKAARTLKDAPDESQQQELPFEPAPMNEPLRTRFPI